MAKMWVSLARDKLLSLLSNKAKLLWNIPKKFVDIKTELDFIQAFLKDADSRVVDEGDNTNEGIRILVKEFREASFRIEDVIDEYLIYVEQQPDALGCATLFFECDIAHFNEYLKHRHQIASEIQQIKSIIDGIMERGKKYNFLNQPSSQQGQSSYAKRCHPRSDPRILKHVEVVGFEDPGDELIGWLMEGPAGRIVICGGLGKTTLVGRVFNNEMVMAHFDSHAWITVSQSYTVGKLMRDLLKKLCKEEKKEPPRDVFEMDQDSLIEEMRNYLQQKRYIIVFDDVWSIELWGQIEISMLENNNGCRILITTRSMDVLKPCKNSSFNKMHELKPLTFEKSMELFNRKATPMSQINERCPEDLVNTSSGFVKKCKGLPLAIVAIGSLLDDKEKTPFEWKKISQSLSSKMEKIPI
ncbi:hypothetical protein JHK87_049564 [Glycine soja]|nr:hypothetical protein JHK87_049564 [Glycine soja]